MSCRPQPTPEDVQNLVTLGKQRLSYLSYESEEKLTWCGGCGDYGVRNALIRALVLEGIEPEDTLLCYDVGCHGNGADKVEAYTFHGLHGRVISLAAGAALANTNVKVVAEGGDGGTFSEGINHLVHSVRNDYPMVFILHNNENYGLTTGQPSSTSKRGAVMNSAPDGVNLDPMRPAHFVLGLNPSFVARTFSGDVKHMTETIRAGLKHDGFAFIEVLQVCTTYNRSTPQTWYWERIKYLRDRKKYDKTDIWEAMKTAYDVNKEINLGILYENPKNEPFLSRLKPREGIKTQPVDEVRHYDIKNLLKKYE